MKLSPKAMGLAFGVAATFFYLGCVLVMTVAGRDALVESVSGLFHGINVAPIVNMHISTEMTVLGLVNTFILSWLFGALIALVYNAAVARRSASS